MVMPSRMNGPAVRDCRASIGFRLTFLAFLMLVLPAAPALPQPCPTEPYPPRDETMTVNSSSTNAGSSITVQGSGFLPGSAVQLAMEPKGSGSRQSLETATADSDGKFTEQVVIPAATDPGEVRVLASGIDCEEVKRDVAAVIQVQDSRGAPPQDVSPGDALSRTGVNALPWLLTALVVILVGLALLVIARQRRRARSDA
jgi:hypothetical protein